MDTITYTGKEKNLIFDEEALKAGRYCDDMTTEQKKLLKEALKKLLAK